MSHSRSRWPLVAVLLIGAFLAMLNVDLVSPSLTAIIGDLGVSAPTAQWLVSGYALVEALIIPLSAWMVGRFGVRRLFLGGFGIFLAGSVLAAAAPAFPVLLAGRLLQAVCTGMVFPVAMNVLAVTFDASERGLAMGLMSLVVGFAPAVGPSLGGILVEVFGWREIFVLVAAGTVLVLALGFALLRDLPSFDPCGIDVPSVALCSLGMLGILYGFSTIGESKTPAIDLAFIVLGTVLTALFVRRQLKLESPMLEMRVFRSPAYAGGVLAIFLFQALNLGRAVMVPLLLQDSLGHTALASGLAMLPGALAGAFAGLVAGRAYDAFAPRAVTAVGGVAAVAGAAWLFLLPDTAGLAEAGSAYAVLSIGILIATTALNAWTVSAVERRYVQHANAVTGAVQQMGGSLGTAALVSLSAHASAAAPAGASAAEASFLGTHAAFGGAVALALAALACVAAFIRRGPRRKSA